jgi:hypothetical protein
MQEFNYSGEMEMDSWVGVWQYFVCISKFYSTDMCKFTYFLSLK